MGVKSLVKCEKNIRKRVRKFGLGNGYLVTHYMKEMMEDMKKTHGVFNPTPGYEPYWVDGSWVFEDPPGVTTPSMPQVCGEECSYLYTEIKEVCGRQTSNKHYIGCSPLFPFVSCYGNTIDDLSGGFRTFETYCKFLDVQCRSRFKDRWILVHRGPCVENQDMVFKPLSAANQPVSRMFHYFTELSNTFLNHTLPPPFESK